MTSAGMPGWSCKFGNRFISSSEISIRTRWNEAPVLLIMHDFGGDLLPDAMQGRRGALLKPQEAHVPGLSNRQIINVLGQDFDLHQETIGARQQLQDRFPRLHNRAGRMDRQPTLHRNKNPIPQILPMALSRWPTHDAASVMTASHESHGQALGHPKSIPLIMKALWEKNASHMVPPCQGLWKFTYVGDRHAEMLDRRALSSYQVRRLPVLACRPCPKT